MDTYRAKRAAALYSEDERQVIRQSHNNPQIKALYDEFLGKPNSHKGKGWETFTDAVIRYLNERERGIVFMLWGGNARAKKSLITNRSHLILECAHPSPLSAYNGFFGCNHFKRANEFLNDNGIAQIDWSKTV